MIYFNQPGKKLNSSKFMEILKQQDQLVEELFQAVRTHKSFKKEKRETVQEKFKDLRRKIYP